jgi:hypothetical protein
MSPQRLVSTVILSIIEVTCLLLPPSIYQSHLSEKFSKKQSYLS